MIVGRLGHQRILPSSENNGFRLSFGENGKAKKIARDVSDNGSPACVFQIQSVFYFKYKIILIKNSENTKPQISQLRLKIPI